MECNRDEALRAKGIAESKYAQRDLAGAKKFLNKAMSLHQGLEGLAQLHAVVDVELAAEQKITGTDSDWYSILQTDPVADEATIKKQYRKLALALHPDKNKFAGAEAAFKLIGEANAVLTNKEKRHLFDMKRVMSLKVAAARQPAPSNGHAPPGTDVLETFWTMCRMCKTEFKYLRKYINHRVDCVHCKASFVATEWPSDQFRWNQQADDKVGGVSNGTAAEKTRLGTGSANSTSVHPAAATAAKETGTGQKSEDVVQQTFAKVRRERVEAEREAKKVLQRGRKGKNREEVVASKDRMPVEDHPESSQRKKDDSLQEKLVREVRQASMEAEPEKKASKLRRRPEGKPKKSKTRSKKACDSSLRMEVDGEEEDEEEEEEEEAEDEDEDEEDVKEVEEEKKDAMAEDGDEDYKVDVSTGREEGEEPPTKLRRSLRKRNNKVAYTFGDTDDEKEEDELINFLVGKGSRLADKMNVASASRGGAPTVSSFTVAENGNSFMHDEARQNTSTKVDGQSKQSEKVRAVDGMTTRKRSYVDYKSVGAPVADEMADEAVGGENSESEWQEYLSKGDKKERCPVNLIHSKEVKESMRYSQTKPDTSKSGVKGKQVVTENVSAAALESSRRKDVTGNMHANCSVSAEGERFGFNIRNMVEDAKEEGGGKSRQLRQRKNADGNGTVNRSSAANGRQVSEKSSPLSAPAPRTTCVISAGRQPSSALPTTPSSCPPPLSEADIEVPDPDFHVFDNERSETEFAEGQVWAIYDDDDGMPRFYGKIDKVVVSPFKVRMHWLETYNYNQSAKWVNQTKLAIPCGDFKLGKSTDVKAVNIFSHLATVGKGLKNVLKIYPRKQEVWAMYQNWEEGWPTANRGRKYDMVEVISDFSEAEGVNVAPLTKLSEYKSVFRRKPGVVDFYPAKQLLRFSHRVPAYRLAGTEAEGLSRDCWSLDTASMPNDLMNASPEPGDSTMNASQGPGDSTMNAPLEPGHSTLNATP